MNNFNSTIEKKKCKCSPGCDKYPTMSCYGYYYAHLPEDLKDKAGTRAKVARKNRNNNIALAHKLRAAQKETNGDSVLDLWFFLKMHTSEKKCENCGADLNHYDEWTWRGSQHHIVDKSPKNGCPSVATNPENHLVLGYWCCHGIWHENFESASKMKIFPEAKRKFQLFKDLIPDSEMRKVNPFLLQTQAANPTSTTNGK